MSGAEITGLEGEHYSGAKWTAFTEDFCKKVWNISRFSAIRVARLEICGDSRKGKVYLAMKPD